MIFVCLTTNQTNELFFKNYDLRFASSNAFPEANFKSSKNSYHFKGRESRHGLGSHRGGDKFDQKKNNLP